MELILENLSFAYRHHQVINQVSLRFHPGRIYSILGPNGCGKTTLLSLLIRHLKPDTGKILLDGSPLERCSRKKISQAVSLVSQQYAVSFPFTVEEVVMMGRHPYIPRLSQPDDQDRDLVNAAMEKAGVTALRHHRITQLSGGETQRCVFARTLCQDTPILLLDEAFSNMDICHTLKLLGLIKKQVHDKNLTVISVFHDINLASAWSDHLIFMKQGKIAASGKTQDVLTEAVLEDVFHVETSIHDNAYTGARQVSFKVGSYV